MRVTVCNWDHQSLDHLEFGLDSLILMAGMLDRDLNLCLIV